MVELLKSGHINNRLLCEIATHEDFVTLMTDTEIYVDGIATMHFNDFNSLLEVLREQVLSKYQPAEEDTALKALETIQVREEDYFCHVTHRTWDAILHSIINLTHINHLKTLKSSIFKDPFGATDPYLIVTY